MIASNTPLSLSLFHRNFLENFQKLEEFIIQVFERFPEMFTLVNFDVIAYLH